MHFSSDLLPILEARFPVSELELEVSGNDHEFGTILCREYKLCTTVGAVRLNLSQSITLSAWSNLHTLSLVLCPSDLHNPRKSQSLGRWISSLQNLQHLSLKFAGSFGITRSLTYPSILVWNEYFKDIRLQALSINDAELTPPAIQELLRPHRTSLRQLRQDFVNLRSDDDLYAWRDVFESVARDLCLEAFSFGRLTLQVAQYEWHSVLSCGFSEHGKDAVRTGIVRLAREAHIGR